MIPTRNVSKQEYADGIMRDLEWLGLTWDRVERQSDRMDRYREAAEDLKRQGPVLRGVRIARRTGPQAQETAEHGPPAGL
jgi:hypothetical protein